MKIIEGNIKDIYMSDKISVALGAFDGIHRGHKKIISKAVDEAKKLNCKSAVLTFKEHPSKIINKDKQVKILTDNTTKAKIIQDIGIDYLILVSFDKAFADMESTHFIDILLNKLNVIYICCGYDYTFGKGGKGNTTLLNYYKDIYHYGLKIVDKVSYKDAKISSTLIRNKIEDGKIKEANILLGHNYFCIGEITMGKKLGRKLGFPTANINIEPNLCLRNGVYITTAWIDGTPYPSISNVGYNPTVNDINRRIETHILDYKNDLYGKTIKVEFMDFIRNEMKFDSVDQLKDRVNRDINTAKQYFSM